MLLMIGKIFFVLGFITSHADIFEKTESEACPDGWETIHRGCYQFVTEGKEWDEAKDYCKQQQGELTSIQSVKEKQGLEQYLGTHHREIKEWWIGFNREGEKGSDWNWLANIPVDDAVTPWFKSAWKRRPGAFCGILHLENGVKVHIARCSSSMGFICEFHTITDRPVSAPTSTTPANSRGATITHVKTTSSPPKSPDDGQSHSKDGHIRTTGDGHGQQPSTHVDETPKTFTTVWTTSDLNKPGTAASTQDGRKTIGMTTLSESPESATTSNPEDDTENDASSPDITTQELPGESDQPTTTEESVRQETGNEGEEDNESETIVGKGERTNPVEIGGYEPSATEETPEETEKPSKLSPTQPAKTSPQTPQPTMVDWEKAYEELEGCYIPATGGSLREAVMAARQFYKVTKKRGCPPVKIGSIKWPATGVDETADVACSKGNGFATFECGSSPACWRGQPDITGCASKKLQSILRQIAVPDEDEQGVATAEPPTVEESIEMSSQLVEVTEREETTMEDIIVTSQVIKALTRGKPGTRKSKKQIEKIVDNVVTAGSNLVSSNKSAMWEEMTQEDRVRSASSLLVAMETATVSMAEEIEEPTVITQKNENIELELRVVDTEKLEKEQKTEIVYDSEESDNSFSIPVETLKSMSKGRLAKAVFITHYSMADILGSKKRKPAKKSGKDTPETSVDNGQDDKYMNEAVEKEEEEEEEETNEGPQLVSYILSASLGSDGPIMKLPKPISFTMKHLEAVDAKYIPLCSFWNVSHTNRLGFWSQEGCRVRRSNKSHTTCECDHMTNFAILLDVHGMEVTGVHKSLLRLVTIIGCVISCTALLAAWITFQCFLSLQGERNSIHKNLAFTLLVAEILFVFGIDQAHQPILCSVIAGFLHYFFLAAFTWMFLEGIHIIFMLVQVFDSSRSRLPYYYLIGYGAPLVVVGASCLFFYKGYGTEEYCWLTTDRYFIWAFAGPVAIILLVNALFLAYAMSTVCRHADYVFSSKEKTPASGIRAWIQGALALEVLLGLTWTLGYFLINDNSLPLAYVFAVLNSLQGLFIFVFHCLLNKKAQKEYRRVARTMVKRTPSTTTHSTFTKRSNNTRNSHEMNHSHETHHNHNHNHGHSPTNSQQKLNATNTHSLA